MSEQPSISKKVEVNPRTARAVAAILSQTRTDEMLRALNQSDGRNQSEQASFLAAESPHLREIYERGGTVVDGVLTVPRENLSAPPEIEITTQRAAVERLTVITNDAAVARELAPQLVEMGERIAGSQPDGETRIKTFGWLYRYLQGRQELLAIESPDNAERGAATQSESQFSEKWRQIVELSEALAELEPKDRLLENSIDALYENRRAGEQDESSMAAEIYENIAEAESEERAEDFAQGGGLIGFDRIETETDLPKIPENLPLSDFEKLLEKTADIDSQLERGVPVREILAPFQCYVETTRLDNELRLVEEEYAKRQTKIIGTEKGAPREFRFVGKREELRELARDRQTLAALRAQKAKLLETVQTSFGESVDRVKVEQSINARNNAIVANNQTGAANRQKIELTEDEAELRSVLIKEKSVGREANALAESISEREKNFRALNELYGEKIPAERKQQLIEKAAALELPVAGILKEKYPELTARERNEKLTAANTFEIQSPAEYLFMRDAAEKRFQILNEREIKKEYWRFDGKNVNSATTGAKTARRETDEHREKMQALKKIEPVFAYKIEGTSRIIKAEPSERAVAGYKFAAEYVSYQLKQPEMRSRFESAIYREYVARLEAAKTASDVVRESYKIRQENHRAAGVWKNANFTERQKLARPLSKNELTLLFLEQPPRSYTAEMSVLKYNFAHYSQAKEKMTDALEAGTLEPSREALQLARSLEGRLNRRDLETKHKATKHFFESLKTENEKLHLKNEFDHQGIYQNLPPHEKDWIYRRTTSQRENLEYKIAYEQQRNQNAAVQPQNATVKTGEAAASLRQEFAAGTLWHQAAILANQKETKNSISTANLDAKTLQAVGFLIHNQSETNNLRLADWLANQKSEELKTAGEILKTFAGATREIDDNRLTVTVKTAETNRVSAADYKNLFERYFPADFEKLKEFRADKGEKFRLEQSRRDGQTALLDAWKQDAQTAIYKEDAPVAVFETERHQMQEIDKIKAAQIECRRAVEIKNAILTKYEEALKKEFAKSNRTISDGDLRAAVERAFAPEKSETLSSEQKAIFERVQDKILSSDFERFTTSAKRLEKGIANINQSFKTIAELRLENRHYKLAPEKAEKIESVQNQYDAARHRAEAEQITAVAREKFSATTIDENGKATATVFDYASGEEREKARIESHRRARIALEPAELKEPDQNPEIQAKALEFADALETAHQASLHRKSEAEIAKAFASAETKRGMFDESLKIEKGSSLSLENKPVTLLIYERELARNERAIAQAKIARMIETGELSLADLETKKAAEIFSAKERDEIRLEAGERTRENLEPKELWARHGDVSERLQQAALGASDALERAHEIYHEAGVEKKEIAQAFSALDAGIVRLKNERRTTRAAAKFINFKTDFKRDLAQMFERGQPSDNPQLLAAMTKGLLINSLEKQNVPPEKIGLTSEKLSEISRTIALAVVEEKKQEKIIVVNNFSAAVSVQENRAGQTKSVSQNQQVPLKTRQFEHTR